MCQAVRIETKSTKDKIFEAAIDLFSRHGYSGVSIRDITRKVGIKESSLYNHYAGKDEILTVIFDYFQSEILKMIPTENEIHDLVSRYTLDVILSRMLKRSQYYADNPSIEKIFRIITMEQFHNQRARDIMLNEMCELPLNSIARIFELMIEKGFIIQVNAKVVAMEYLFVLKSLVSKFNIYKSFDMNTDEIEADMNTHLRFIYETVRKKDD